MDADQVCKYLASINRNVSIIMTVPVKNASHKGSMKFQYWLKIPVIQTATERMTGINLRNLSYLVQAIDARNNFTAYGSDCLSYITLMVVSI